MMKKVKDMKMSGKKMTEMSANMKKADMKTKKMKMSSGMKMAKKKGY